MFEEFIKMINHEVFIQIFIAMIICQVIKLVTKSVEKKRLYIKGVLENGGMPSSHSTAVTSLATSIGLFDGFDSTTFFIAALFAIVVMIDAKGLRHHVDTLGDILNKIIKSEKLNMKQFDLITGHTLVQVVAGLLLGLAVTLVTNYLITI